MYVSLELFPFLQNLFEFTRFGISLFFYCFYLLILILIIFPLIINVYLVIMLHFSVILSSPPYACQMLTKLHCGCN